LFFLSIVADDNEPGVNFLVSFSSVEDDKKPHGLSLFLGFFPQMEKMTTEGFQLVVIS
jgi:hypothetical protein